MTPGIPVLVTGFGLFRDYTVNPSEHTARRLEELHPGVVQARVLTVEHRAAREELLAALEAVRPRFCLCLGLAPRACSTMERRARKPAAFADLPGAAEHAAAWPPGLLETVEAGRLPDCQCSEDAGQYVCEATLWALLQFRVEHHWPQYAGFLHVPAVSDQWPLERIMAHTAKLVALMIENVGAE